MSALPLLPLFLAAALSAQDTQPFQISVSLDLVVLHATVRDNNGRIVSDLLQEDLRVSEDGMRQALRLFRREDTPVTVGLLVDHSGSMRSKINDVLAAADAFVRASNSLDEMFVVNFNEHVRLGLPSSIGFTNNSEVLQRAISKDPADGQTALYDAIEVGLKRLDISSLEKKVLIVISDGGDTASKRKLQDILKLAQQSSTIIYTIGIYDLADPDRNPGVLKRLSQATGGEAFLPDPKVSLIQACERIASDIRHQYTIGYVSTNTTNPGTYRTIRITASKPGKGKLNVRTRTGYRAPAANR